ncbi:MAG: hypothetical protein M1457_12485 [bacterium]|nr:hypothetical protein [bacterium]
MKAEPILAKLYELRKDYADEPESDEYLALHHAFCFLSYKVSEFQKYLDDAQASAGGGDSETDA